MSALDWSHRLTDLPQTKHFEYAASDEERAGLAELFAGAKCHGLKATYEIRPKAKGRYKVIGRLVGRFEQPCVVTLEPVLQDIDERIDVEFWPPEHVSADTPTIDVDAVAGDDPEPIEKGEIKIGRLICELVSCSLDPYPRRDDANLENIATGGDGQAVSEAANRPFAILAELKRRPGSKKED